MWPFTILFSPDTPLLLRFAVSLILVIGLLVLGLYLLKKYAPGILPGVVKKNEDRLELVSAQQIDGRRILMIVRRDHVEHLLMIGGPNDVLIESGIQTIQLQEDTPPLQENTLFAQKIEPKLMPTKTDELVQNSELDQRLQEVMQEAKLRPAYAENAAVASAAMAAVASTLQIDAIDNEQIEVAVQQIQAAAEPAFDVQIDDVHRTDNKDAILEEMKALLGRQG